METRPPLATLAVSVDANSPGIVKAAPFVCGKIHGQVKVMARQQLYMLPVVMARRGDSKGMLALAMSRASGIVGDVAGVASEHGCDQPPDRQGSAICL